MGQWASLTFPSEISVDSSLGGMVMVVADSGREGASDVKNGRAGRGQLCPDPPAIQSPPTPSHPPGAMGPTGELWCQGVTWPLHLPDYLLLCVWAASRGSKKLGWDRGQDLPKAPVRGGQEGEQSWPPGGCSGLKVRI